MAAVRVYTRTPVIDRIMAKVVMEGDCWVWTGAVGSSGYGHVAAGGRRGGMVSVHRTVWEHQNGPIPDGLQLDHLCGVIRCCNPEHLEPVTHKENQRRRAARIAHCKNGHAFTEANTRHGKNGRECRACHADRERKRRARRKTARHALFAAVKDGGLPDPLSNRFKEQNR